MKQKFCVLVAEQKNGKLLSIPGTSIEDLLKVAKQARVTGKIGKVAITAGVVLASWRLGPAFKFVVQALEAVQEVQKALAPETPEKPEATKSRRL